jgi:hypothetical protein
VCLRGSRHYRSGVALTALDRAEEACVVLRKALNVTHPVAAAPAAAAADDAAVKSSSSDGAALAAALRKAAARLPLTYVCEHWRGGAR